MIVKPCITILALCSIMLTSLLEAKPFKGGELASKETYHYGRYVMRMQMARGSGILSTFFTYKEGAYEVGSFWEEIDIEILGKDDARSWQSNIITGFGQPTAKSVQVHRANESLADAYHTYELHWTPDYVAWYFDGQEVRRTTSYQTAQLGSPQSFRFNIWSAFDENWVGALDESALPAWMYVNWLEYYRYNQKTGQFDFQWRDDFDLLNGDRWTKAVHTFDENRVDFEPDNILIRDGALLLGITRENNTGYDGEVPFDRANDNSVEAGGP